MVDYSNRNEFPKIKKDFIKKETFEKLRKYLKSPKFKKDLKETYWEHTGTSDNQTSNLISFSASFANTNGYKGFELHIRDDEDLNRNNLDINKLKYHYKNLLDIIFESE